MPPLPQVTSTVIPPSAGSARSIPEEGSQPAACELSLVVPAHNEEPNVRPLFERVVATFGKRSDWELVLVDDGSTDGTTDAIRELARHDARVVGVLLARRGGQSAATAAGVREARGRLI